MSCFLLPKSLCQELEIMFNKYWWRSGSNSSKGVNWLAWNAMSSAKSLGGLGFRSLYGFNIALLGKQCWNFMTNPRSLVARLFKARYYSNTSIFEARKGHNPSFIRQGLLTALNSLRAGFRWVVGDGESIVATRDQWLRSKQDFCVTNDHRYAGRMERVSTYIDASTKTWNSTLIFNNFLLDDAKAIVAIPLPRGEVHDHIVWAQSNTGVYSAKEGYKFWLNHHSNHVNGSQSSGWKRLWSLFLPNKIKLFIWRFCRDTIPTRWKLRGKGIRLPISCPFCHVDVEHVLHIFFDCHFDSQCWHHSGLVYNMSQVENASLWLLDMQSNANSADLNKICVILSGIWMWRNKLVWEEKATLAAIAMNYSFNHVTEWKKARTKAKDSAQIVQPSKFDHKWKPPVGDALKINVDASFKSSTDKFSVGMVLRNYAGEFLASRSMCLPGAATVFEAEAIATKEALSWIKTKQLHNHNIQVETDSMLVVNGIKSKGENLLEVGEVLNQCKMLLRDLDHTSIHFVRNQANRVAHELARLPCLVNCHVDFMSLPSCLEEAVLRDSSF